ncbi:MAG: glycosyltransferase family 2 protein, partial [Mesorhizobium sp.]
VGMLPGRMALAVLSWKLDAASRPAFLARFSKSIRQAMG